MWPRSEADKDEEEPDWIKTEREQFQNFRDKNKDGKMDRQEVKHWIIPDDYDHSNAEAKHLIFEADASKVVFLVLILFFLLLMKCYSFFFIGLKVFV